MSEVRSTSTQASSRRRSSEIAAAMPSRTGSTPPTTLVPPPNGVTATRCSAHAASTAATCSAEAGNTTASGALEASPERIRTRSGYDRPTAWAIRSSRPSSTRSAPTAAARRSRAGPESRESGTETCSRPTGGRRAPGSTPSSSRSMSSATGGSWTACPSSPQPHQRISRRLRQRGELPRATPPARPARPPPAWLRRRAAERD